MKKKKPGFRETFRKYAGGGSGKYKSKAHKLKANTGSGVRSAFGY